MRYDLIIIGTDLKVPIFTEIFKDCSARIAIIGEPPSAIKELKNIEVFTAPFELLDYRNRLFGCYLEGGIRLFSTTILVAMGTKNIPLLCKNKQVPNAYYDSKSLPKNHKESQAVILGSSQKCLRLALDLSKKFRYLYLCTETFDLQGTDKQKARLEACKNVVVLPGAKLLSVTTKNGTLQSIELDTYSTITCSAVYADTPTIPATRGIPVKFFNLSPDKFLITTPSGESTIIPSLFATGSCCAENNPAELVYKTILTTIGGKE